MPPASLLLQRGAQTLRVNERALTRVGWFLHFEKEISFGFMLLPFHLNGKLLVLVLFDFFENPRLLVLRPSQIFFFPFHWV
jgi:hypothetical protein